MTKNFVSGVVAVILAACAIAFPAVSHEEKGHGHATGVVRERMELMESIGARMKAVNSRLKSKQQLGAIKNDARAIAQSAANIVRLFPPGSTQHPTEARAAIWQNFADFERKAKALETESAKLASIPEGDVAALAAQVRAVSQTCSGCHETYRLRR